MILAGLLMTDDLVGYFYIITVSGNLFVSFVVFAHILSIYYRQMSCFALLRMQYINCVFHVEHVNYFC